MTGFKSRLDTFRLNGYQANKLGHYLYWELSYDIFDRIEVSVENRISYVNYIMKENPLIARRKKVNLNGLVT